jgi:hypothetical protein
LCTSAKSLASKRIEAEDAQIFPESYETRTLRCQKAFNTLVAMKESAFPVLLEHLDDPRQSINFSTHALGNSVGDACYWIMHVQLMDRPPNYGNYGYARTGRDGKSHPNPYWASSPFDDAGGIKPWLETHAHLSYREKQIRCLQWLVQKEKEIGARDPDSYFETILPLEIQLLTRQKESGKAVEQELKLLQDIYDHKRVEAIPPELLP